MRAVFVKLNQRSLSTIEMSSVRESTKQTRPNVQAWRLPSKRQKITRGALTLLESRLTRDKNGPELLEDMHKHTSGKI